MTYLYYVPSVVMSKGFITAMAVRVQVLLLQKIVFSISAVELSKNVRCIEKSHEIVRTNTDPLSL